MSNTPSLLPCPFCGAPAHGYAIAPHSHSPAVLRLVPELPDHPGCYVIEGQCACGSGLIGANESEVTARWNRRTPQQEAQEPVAWQSRTRPTWGGNTRPWSPWEPCTKGQAEDCWKTPLLNDWAYEARALYTTPLPAPDCHHRPPCNECAAIAAQGGK